MKLTVKTSQSSYPIYMERGSLHHIDHYIDLKRKVLILTDSNVPKAYASAIQAQCMHAQIYTIAAGETSKSFEVYQQIIEYMLSLQFDRSDLLIALGGGVVGDLGGFVAATYMRGIAFVNIPTTTLAQIDSSIGGKVAVNVGHTKNIVGAFYPPTCVIIDLDTLDTLPQREYHSGLAEAIKAGLIRDPQLFTIFESAAWREQIEEIVYRSLLVKKQIVEEDEFEQGDRKLLNFGHTIGHALESSQQLGHLLHGEAIALGMLPMIREQSLKERVKAIYQTLNLPQQCSCNLPVVYDYILQDKKRKQNEISLIFVTTLGAGYIEQIPAEQIKHYLEELL